MNFDWQAAAAPAIVFAAIAYLARAFVGRWFRKPKPGTVGGGCGSCGSCSAGGRGSTPLPMVTLTPMPPSDRA